MIRTKHNLARGAAGLAFGQVATQASTFIRSVILARLISPANFGIAAIFSLTFALMEMISNIAAQNLIVQAPDGDEPAFEATGHFLLVVRGITNSVVLVCIAGPAAALFGVPDARNAFRCAAVIPMLRGLNHLDITRFHRQMRFTPQVVVDILSSVVPTCLAWPLAIWRRDYTAMLWLLVLQSALSTVLSQLLAERPYRVRWNKEYARRFFAFGWPLLINGLLLYGILQGDRFVIGIAQRVFPSATYTLADLGIYSVAFSVTMAPSSLVVSIASALFLPVLSRAQALRKKFVGHFRVCLLVCTAAALMLSVTFIVSGRWIVMTIYGTKYVLAGKCIPWLGIMWGLRVFRAAPTLAAMALGDTRNAMVSNCVRTIALVGVLASAAMGWSLAGIAICGAVGELLASAASVLGLARDHGLAPRLALRPLGVCLGAMLIARLGMAGPFGLDAALILTVGLGVIAWHHRLGIIRQLKDAAGAFLEDVRPKSQLPVCDTVASGED